MIDYGRIKLNLIGQTGMIYGFNEQNMTIGLCGKQISIWNSIEFKTQWKMVHGVWIELFLSGWKR